MVMKNDSPGDHVPNGGIFTPFEPKRRIAKDEVLNFPQAFMGYCAEEACLEPIYAILDAKPHLILRF